MSGRLTGGFLSPVRFYFDDLVKRFAGRAGKAYTCFWHDRRAPFASPSQYTLRPPFSATSYNNRLERKKSEPHQEPRVKALSLGNAFAKPSLELKTMLDCGWRPGKAKA
jgi:hypothetical protein